MYQNNQTSLERRRTELPELMRAVAQHVLATASDLTPSDCQFLSDVARSENTRYQWKGLDRFLDLASRAGNPLLLSEALRDATFQRIAPLAMGLLDVHLNETRSQAPHDISMAVLLNEKTPTRRDHAIETGTQHFYALRTQLDVLHSMPINGRKVFV
jgi:hypothetical protein